MDKIVDNVNNLVQAIENYGYGQQLLFQGDFSGSGAVKRKRRCEAETAGSVDRLRNGPTTQYKKYREGLHLHGQEEWKNEKEVAQIVCTASHSFIPEIQKILLAPT